jgi:hypothetical protein
LIANIIRLERSAGTTRHPVGGATRPAAQRLNSSVNGLKAGEDGLETCLIGSVQRVEHATKLMIERVPEVVGAP